MEVENLINEMLKVKSKYPSLENSEVLQIFTIKTNIELTNAIKRLSGLIK